MYFVKAPESGSVESSDDGRTVADAAGLEDAVLHLEAVYGRHALIARARGLPAKNQRKWVAETLKKNDDWRCALLVIDPNETVPLHDHPGACGTHLVLSGGARHHLGQQSTLNCRSGAMLRTASYLCTRTYVCGREGTTSVIANIDDPLVIEKIPAHLDAKGAAAEASRRPFCRWAQLGKASRGGAIAPIGAWGFKLTPDRGENRGPSDGMGDREVMVSGIEKRVYPTYTGRRQVKIPMCVPRPLSESEPFLLLTAGDDTPDQS